MGDDTIVPCLDVTWIPGPNQEHMAAFAQAKGFEKCGLPPGLGARLAAQFMIECME